MRHAACRRWLVVLAGCLLVPIAAADTPCRVAFDLGSSGIRAGASGQSTTVQTDIDYLGPLWAGRGLDETVGPTIFALRDLPNAAHFPPGCVRVGGGFSAWRLQAEQDPSKLADLLQRIRLASDVAVLVIPQQAEGGYGHFGARRLLGERLTSSHILDIGGGSLQIAGEHTAFGAALGQKIWRRELCQALRGDSSAACVLQPMTADDLATARALLAGKLQNLSQTLGSAVTMTAISRPVTRGIVPAVSKLQDLPANFGELSRPALQAAIDQLAGWTLAETAERLAIPTKFAAYLLSDMLLVDGLLQATGSDRLTIAEIELTNLPGLLADERAYRWATHYDCYLQRLRQLGSAAYASDIASCPAP